MKYIEQKIIYYGKKKKNNIHKIKLMKIRNILSLTKYYNNYLIFLILKNL